MMVIDPSIFAADQLGDRDDGRQGDGTGSARHATVNFTLTLLDRFALFRGDAEIIPPIGCQRLIALITLGSAKTRAHLGGTLWPDVREEQASGSLRSMVWRVQRMAPGLLQARGPTLSLSSNTHVDVGAFLTAVQQLLARPSEVNLDDYLSEAMWADLLPGWYEDWVLLERERLRQLRLHALETLALQLSSRGQYGNALDAALSAVRAEPLRESAHRVIAQVHILEGNRVEALRQFKRYQQLVTQELGVEPSPEFAALVTLSRQNLACDHPETTIARR